MPESVLISELLLAWAKDNALNILIPLVERELRHIAASHLRGERQNHTLQTTALVNETFLRLVKQNDVPWQGRIHFFAIASRIMRQDLDRLRQIAKSPETRRACDPGRIK